MLKKIKIWHFILLTCAIIIIAQSGLLFDIFLLLVNYVFLLFSKTDLAFVQFNFPLADHFLSLILIIIIPLLTFLKRHTGILDSRLTFNSVVLILMCVVFLFAPLMTNTNPDFQKDLRVTKLLPPLSTVKIIHLNVKQRKYDHKFFELRDKVIRSSFDESLIFADSIKYSGNLTYFQKGKSVELQNGKVKIEDNIPTTETNLYLLGTDEFGRDVFARLIYGTRISLFVGLGAVSITLILGIFLGFIAGYNGGLIDSVISRFTDMLLSFPIIFLIILILALFGNSLLTVIMVLGYSGWMGLFKIVRGEVISIKQKDFFITAKLAGLSSKNLLLKEIFPIILAPIIVNTVFQYGNVILAESGLSYLGIGIGNMYPSWGGMIESGQEYLGEAWWMILFPGLALFVTLFTANNLGKEINFYFNPRLKHD